MQLNTLGGGRNIFLRTYRADGEQRACRAAGLEGDGRAEGNAPIKRASVREAALFSSEISTDHESKNQTVAYLP